MKDIFKQDLEKGDIVAIISMGSRGWTSTWVGVLDGTFTKGGKPRYFMAHFNHPIRGRRGNDYKSRMIKITEDQLIDILANETQRETILEMSRDLKQ